MIYSFNGRSEHPKGLHYAHISSLQLVTTTLFPNFKVYFVHNNQKAYIGNIVQCLALKIRHELFMLEIETDDSKKLEIFLAALKECKIFVQKNNSPTTF